MEVAVPTQDLDFHFDSSNTTPNVSTPSSPKRFGDSFDYYYHHYASTPKSPSRAADIGPLSPSSVDAETRDDEEDHDNFVFNFSGQKGALPQEPTAADKLFEKGKIRPLKPPPRPVSPMTRGLWSTRRSGERETNPFSTSFSRSRKGSRSLSPLRGGGGGGGGVGVFENSPNSSPVSTSSTSTTKGRGSKKWKLRDLLLFRSASEGRATGNRSKDPLRRFTIFPSLSPSSSNKERSGAKTAEELRNASFRSADSSGSIRRVRSGVAISAHEMHYRENRAAAEVLKKTTPLPYRHGLFDFLGLNPSVNSIKRGIHKDHNYSFNHKR